MINYFMLYIRSRIRATLHKTKFKIFIGIIDSLDKRKVISIYIVIASIMMKYQYVKTMNETRTFDFLWYSCWARFYFAKSSLYDKTSYQQKNSRKEIVFKGWRLYFLYIDFHTRIHKIINIIFYILKTISMTNRMIS